MAIASFSLRRGLRTIRSRDTKVVKRGWLDEAFLCDGEGRAYDTLRTLGQSQPQ